MLVHDPRDVLTDDGSNLNKTKAVQVIHWIVKYVLVMKGANVFPKYLREGNNVRQL